MEIENSGRKQSGSPRRPGNPAWEPGISGNPAGKPKGARNRSTLAMEALLDQDAEAIIEKAIELAKAGDMTAIRLCLDRLCPPRKDRHVTFELPLLNSAADASRAAATIIAAVSAGELTPAEAAELGKLVESYARTLEATEFEERLATLEKTVRK